MGSVFDYFRRKKKPERISGLKGAGIPRRPGGEYKHAHFTEEESLGFLDRQQALTHSDVRSSCIFTVQYFATDEILRVQFHKDDKPGPNYFYRGVPRAVAIEFLRAGSKGSFISTRIVQGGYPFTRVG